VYTKLTPHRMSIADSRMDITRKFIQMGRTRSLRYALRKGGVKYDYGDGDGDETKTGVKAETSGKEQPGGERSREDESREAKPERNTERQLDAHGHRLGGTEIPRTGEVFDQGKLDGAGVFERYLERCWEDEVYKDAWEEWRAEGKGKAKLGGQIGSKGKGKGRMTLDAPESHNLKEMKEDMADTERRVKVEANDTEGETGESRTGRK
jgi:hypothetical protein